MSKEGIPYIDRITQEVQLEEVMALTGLKLLYGYGRLGGLLGRPLCQLISRSPYFSRIVGWFQKRPFTKKSIQPFVERFAINTEEFEKPVSSFSSFSDFFIRKLNPSVRPIEPQENVAVIPADGRYYFFPSVDRSLQFMIKGATFTLSMLLQNQKLAETYARGSLVLARLSPSDYHRFHFPIDCRASESQLIDGSLYSVNPFAIKKRPHIFWENRRSLTALHSSYGTILYVEIGATAVGNIVQTYRPGCLQRKGGEKGYFNFGGSALALLFPPSTICFDEDLLSATRQGMEIRCLMGQSMGRLNARES